MGLGERLMVTYIRYRFGLLFLCRYGKAVVNREIHSQDQSGMAGAMESMATDVGKIEALVGKMGGSVAKIDTLPLRIDEMVSF